MRFVWKIHPRFDIPGIPTSQELLKNGLARARTSLGVRAKSKESGMAVPIPDKMFRIVWWRASTVNIEAAEVRRTGSLRRAAPPRYAETPTDSTIRAVAAIVVTLVSALEKSN
jgi:hypothetical protein